MIERIQAAVPPTIEIRGILGRGGFATVYEGYDTRLKRALAVKVLHEELDTAHYRERFRREVEMVARLRHPHIVPVYDVGAADGVLWYSMPLITGTSLRARLDAGPLPVDEARRMLLGIASALQAAHTAGLMHRDIKPDNILIDAMSGDALLTDFGIAKAIEADGPSLTSTGLLVGTPHYMSPEQLAADGPADIRSDIYALGVVGYQSLSGGLPFEGASLPVLIAKVLSEDPIPLTWRRPDCPTALADAVMHCLTKSPAERWQSADEFRTALHLRSSAPASQMQSGHARGGGVPAIDVHGAHVATARRELRRAMIGYAGVLVVALALELATRSLLLSPIIALMGIAHVATILSRAWVAGAHWREVAGGRVVPALHDATAAGPITDPASHRLLQALRTERRILGALLHRLPKTELSRSPGVADIVAEVVAEGESAFERVLGIDTRLSSLRARRRSSAVAGRGGDWDQPISQSEEAGSAATLRREREVLVSGMEHCADALRALRMRVQERGLTDSGSAINAVTSASLTLRSMTPAEAASAQASA